MRARCPHAMVRRVRRVVAGPGPAVGSRVRWVRGTTNRWVGARFVALFAAAHAPDDSVEADRARGLNSPQTENIVHPTVLPLQGEVPAKQAEGAHRPEFSLSRGLRPAQVVRSSDRIQADCSCISGGLRLPERQIDGCAPDSSLCSLTLTLRTTRSRLTEPETSPPTAKTPSPPQSSPFRGRCLRSRRRGPTGLNSLSPGASDPHKPCPPPPSSGCPQARTLPLPQRKPRHPHSPPPSVGGACEAGGGGPPRRSLHR